MVKVIFLKNDSPQCRIFIVGAIGGRGGAESFDTILTDVNCIGNESSLLECSAMKADVCASEEIATVICQGRHDVLQKT